MKPTQTLDSHCVVCKCPAAAPRGNFNAKRVTLCLSPECRRQRKSELQRERRRQLVLPLDPAKLLSAELVSPEHGSECKAAADCQPKLAASKTGSALAKAYSGARARWKRQRGIQDPLWPSN